MRKMLYCLIGALIGPITVVVLMFVLKVDFVSSILSYPWRIIFAIGILFSLWAQLMVNLYFRRENFLKYTKINPFFDTIEVSLPVLMT